MGYDESIPNPTKIGQPPDPKTRLISMHRGGSERVHAGRRIGMDFDLRGYR